MRKNTPYRPTEWEWLKLRLEVHSLLNRGSEYCEMFEFDQEIPISCRIQSSSIDRMVSRKMPRKEQLVCYRSWARSVKRHVEEILAGLPVLRREFDPDRHLVVEIMRDYGTGAYRFCSLRGKHVHWH